MPNTKQQKALLVLKSKEDNTMQRTTRLDKKVTSRLTAHYYYREAQGMIDEALKAIKPDLNESELALLLSARLHLTLLYSERLIQDGQKNKYSIEDYGGSLKAILPYIAIEARKKRGHRYKSKSSRVKHVVKGFRTNIPMMKEPHKTGFSFRLPCCIGWPLTRPFCREPCECHPKR
jgi:hypothetical protein